MFEKTEALAYFFCEKYPTKTDLSKARINKLIYLADWKFCLEKGEQITDVPWLYNHHGPYVPEIIEHLVETGNFALEQSKTFRGYAKEVLYPLKSDNGNVQLSSEEEEVARFVLEQTGSLTFEEFIKLVYSTYPIITSEKGAQLNLPELARKCKEKKDLFVQG